MAKRVLKPWSERKNGVKPNVRKALDENDMDALTEHLPKMQKAFAEEYIKDFSGSKAVQRCGSTTQFPEKLAYIWLNNLGVKAYINHLTEERTRQLKIDQGYVVQKLIRTLEKAEAQSNHAAVLRAAELLARHLGMFVEKIEHTGRDGEAIQIEKVKDDADAFTRSIASIAKRGGKSGETLPTEH